jgi:hypothetical protein
MFIRKKGPHFIYIYIHRQHIATQVKALNENSSFPFNEEKGLEKQRLLQLLYTQFI